MTRRRQQKAISGGAALACGFQSMSHALSTTDGTRTFDRMQGKLHEVHGCLITKVSEAKGLWSVQHISVIGKSLQWWGCLEVVRGTMCISMCTGSVDACAFVDTMNVCSDDVSHNRVGLRV